MEKLLEVMSGVDTLNYVLEHQCSIARYGDGEIDYMFQNRNIGFQNSSEELANKLMQVLKDAPDNLLICMPSVLNSVDELREAFAHYWVVWGSKGYKEKAVALVKELAPKDYVFGDTQVTRPYMDYKSADNAEQLFPLLKKLWENRDILIVEGSKTRLGVGNDLFDGAKSIKRILAPAVSAFESYDKIYQCIMDHYHGELILLALGPTATVLASDFAHQNMQALDIGHVDIEYEWFLKKATQKEPVEGKYVNEAENGNIVGECKDEKYLSQIIATVEA